MQHLNVQIVTRLKQINLLTLNRSKLNELNLILIIKKTILMAAMVQFIK